MVHEAEARILPGQAMCSIHDMIRSKRFLRRNMTTGEYYCNSKHGCTTERPMGYCIKHGKNRSMSDLREGPRGLKCKLDKECKPILTGRCQRCSVECSDYIRATWRKLMPSYLVRYLPKSPQIPQHEERALLCGRCARAFDALVDDLRDDVLTNYKSIVSAKLKKRMHKSNASLSTRELLINSLDMGYPDERLIGFDWTSVNVSDWVQALCIHCHVNGLSEPDINIIANKSQIRRARKLLDGQPRFPVPFQYSVKIGNDSVVGSLYQSFPDTAYYNLGGNKIRRKLRMKAAIAGQDHHRDMYDECLGSVVGSRNVRTFGDQIAARAALMVLLTRQRGEGFDKQARAVLDTLMPGPEFERRAFQRQFRGKKNSPRVIKAATEFIAENFKKTSKWMLKTVTYDDDYGQI